ncbi:alpha/beta fold hydrolase [Albidovulum sediminicola]|uniref:Alpha/beta hydrolase n=1 Tax=Albidovulum sediminicola TaxID=2984331 RepID=A0ABT2Z5U8_9RHOB|nr:alpha/beta hydrolase [Defluviimonas sp. WL0075]MCV2866441.1 alpha/beta hydrolase [Defluviimonas sp. WL0075]
MPEGIRAGHRTFWRVMGAGERPALGIHCALAHSGAWAGVMVPLAERITLTAFDLPGHGKSDDWSGQGDYPRLCAEIAASFIDRPVDLIGHSFGAVTALRLAIAAPEAFRTLTLIEPVLFAAAQGTPAWAEYQADIAPFRAAMAEGRPEEAARAFTSLWGTGVDWTRLNAESRSALVDRIGMIPASDPALADDSGRVLRPDGLESLDMPVLMIQGERSPAIISAIAEALAARMQDVGIATVPGASHMLPITHPKEVAGLIAVNLDRA